MVASGPKFFTLQVGGRQDTVSVDRLKPCLASKWIQRLLHALAILHITLDNLVLQPPFWGGPCGDQEIFQPGPGEIQGWEFAHLISEQIAHFLSKNERMSASLKKMSYSLIRSF